jgi:hypothetical protein
MLNVGTFCGWLATALALAAAGAHAGPWQPVTPVLRAPPPAPPVQHRDSAAAIPQSGSAQLMSAPPGQSLYSIGDPTDEEQLYVESMNRARANPPAEGLRLQASTDPDILENYKAFDVDLALMVMQFAAIAPAPPLSINPLLTAAARGHSLDMLTNAFQGHDGSDGSTFGSRASSQGYQWNLIGENVFAYAHTVAEGHAGFEVDWGGSSTNGGMQNPPGHRLNIHNPRYQEVGVGVILGTNGDVGPQLVTEDFGERQGLSPFLTGVVYYDLNGNGAYDLGEGLGGVTVTATGANYYAVTATSGGYSIPVPGNGNYTVTFAVGGLSNMQVPATVSGGVNVKLDHSLPYAPPSISGADKPAVNQNNVYFFTSVGGATGYQWKLDSLVPATAVEGAENGLGNVTVVASPGYSVLDSTIRASGNDSFHLAHPGASNAPPVDQILTLNPTFRAGPTATLLFASRLGWATPQEIAHAQISADGGQSWQDVWTQAGTGTAGETGFTTRTVNLSTYAGQDLKVRFVYSVAGSFFPQTDPGVGFYIDNISWQGADQVVKETITDLGTDGSFTFVPPQAGDFGLSVRPKAPGRLLPWGPTKSVTAQVGTLPTPSVQITAVRLVSGTQMQIDFAVTNSGAGVYITQSAPDLKGPWIIESGASVQSLSGNASYRVSLASGSAPRRFFRIAAQ